MNLSATGIPPSTPDTATATRRQSAAAAVDAGIIHSDLDSGKDNLVALIDPQKYQRQIEFFHTLFPFQKLGIVYEDNPTGRSVIALKQIETATHNLNVQLVRCSTYLHDKNLDLVAENVEACHSKLVEQQVDAVYLTYNVTLSPEQTKHTLAPLIKAGIPTFSQAGEYVVKCGAMISFVDAGEEEGRNAARLLLAIRNGISPRKLSQHFQSPLLLIINIRTAALIGWNPSLKVLLNVDKFYE